MRHYVRHYWPKVIYNFIVIESLPMNCTADEGLYQTQMRRGETAMIHETKIR